MESRSTDRETLVRRTSQAATQDLRPETFGRFDLECVFNKLDYLTINRIGELHLANCLEIINSQGHAIECGSGVLEYVQREEVLRKVRRASNAQNGHADSARCRESGDVGERRPAGQRPR